MERGGGGGPETSLSAPEERRLRWWLEGKKTLLLGPEGKAEGWRRRRRREKRDPIRGPFCSKPPSSFLARGGIRQWHAGNRTKNVAGAIDRKLVHNISYVSCAILWSISRSPGVRRETEFYATAPPSLFFLECVPHSLPVVFFASSFPPPLFSQPISTSFLF